MVKTLLRATLLSSLIGVGCGVASAAFLLLLELVTRFRVAHDGIVYALPVAGFAVGALYDRWGARIKGGSNLVLDALHEEKTTLPLRIAPMVLVGTVLTHLFGGSAGREGTAVQIGAALADAVARRVRAPQDVRRVLIVAGVAGGFGSVFGTPVAGALFGLELVCVGRIEHEALVPALVAALVGDFVTRHLGVAHALYPAIPNTALTAVVLAKLVLLGVAMAAATVAFVASKERLKHLLEAKIPRLSFRLLLGGAAVVGLWRVIGTSDYLGLGVPTILRAFSDPTLPWASFALKAAFTVVTLASGFLGGEVTPLFFVGATLGSVLARALGLPIELGAGAGLVAVFGAGANTPIALSIMAVELFGATALPHVAIVCFIAYALSGHRSLYPSQRILRRKQGGDALGQAVKLADFDDALWDPARGASERPSAAALSAASPSTDRRAAGPIPRPPP